MQRAFLLRSCSDGFFESRTRPCLLYQIKRCSAPCTNEIEFADYAELVREANAFLSGSQAVRDQLASEMEKASPRSTSNAPRSTATGWRHCRRCRARRASIPASLEEADVFAIHQAGGYSCIEVFFFRTGQNWGNRAYFPKADRSLGAGEVLGAFAAQFYDDKPSPRCILLSDDIPERALLAAALGARGGRKVEVSVPQRGERKDLVAHALANAREALGRKLADTSSQQRLLIALGETFGLPRAPRRIEVYDNSHIQGSNAVGAMIVAGPEGFRKNQYRKFNIRSADLAPGDDFGMMREMLERRFKRLIAEAPRVAVPGLAIAELAPSPSPHSPSQRGVNALSPGEGGEPRSGEPGEGSTGTTPHPLSLRSGTIPQGERVARKWRWRRTPTNAKSKTRPWPDLVSDRRRSRPAQRRA